MRSERALPRLDVLDPQVCGVKDFIFKGDEKRYDIWFDAKNNRTYEEHKVYKFGMEDLSLYQERKDKFQDWMGVQFVSVREELGCQHLRVFTERILVKLNQIEHLDFLEAMMILTGSLKGFKSLHQRFGAFQITQKMICINQQRKVKVWLNDHHFINLQDKLQFFSNQTDMVLTIFKLVQSKISDSKELISYKSQKQNNLKIKTFDKGLAFMNQVLALYSIPQGTQIDLSKLRINRQSCVIPKLKFERKNGLKRENKRKIVPKLKIDTESKQNAIRKTFQKTRSVKYFKSPSNEQRSRSKSIFSEKLSFSSRSRGSSMKNSYGFQLLSPKSLIKSQNLKSQMMALKASQSTDSETKNPSPNSHKYIPPKPPKTQELFPQSTRSQLNIKFIKQSIIFHHQSPQSRNEVQAQQLFKDLKLFTSVKDLKKSQFLEDHGPYTPPTNTLLQSFPRSSSVLARSFYDTNIKQVIEQEYD